LSQRFLSAKCARMLVLAGQERLDKDLMVGQMWVADTALASTSRYVRLTSHRQGKFQLEVLPDVGHYLHEVRLTYFPDILRHRPSIHADPGTRTTLRRWHPPSSLSGDETPEF
jgi:hypothetical protein